MRRLLSVDLAYKKIRDFGACKIAAGPDGVWGIFFVSPEELGLSDPPDAHQCAKAIHAFCVAQRVSAVMLDGPQGWKDPKSALQYSRCCERILNAPAKTGLFGHVKPKSYTPFVQFSTSLFVELVNLGAELLCTPTVPAAGKKLIALEILPLSAWKKLCLNPLPAKKKAKPNDLTDRLRMLDSKFNLRLHGAPSHDELQALVSGLAGIGFLSGDPNGYIAEGAPPRKTRDGFVEGYIVNPRC